MKMLAGILTGLNLFCGLAAVIFAIEGEALAASWMILVAVVLDGLDGAAARLFSSASDFGRHFDSLSDIVSFGVAPCILAYSVFRAGLEFCTALSLFAYLLAGVIRLSYYCLGKDEDQSVHFSGLPITVAGGFSAAILYMSVRFPHLIFSIILPVLLCLLAFLMVSNVPYPNMRGINQAPKGKIFLFGSILAAAAGPVFLYAKAAIFAPEFGASLFFLFYIAFSPFLLRRIV
ncbi:MAG: CDP-diacylglycerol--serine O-phosphatidyltransferase [Candidatus Omnitrophica bacterium]|nr:CDP-diacylglycerol--serine O-phosphatidyltransferase [Candidatus Omnitrophota bacterium]